ncbi:MAG: periplasmic heavy metal sensor [Gammaproteobacteria bacterium]|nr:MAG: periplasmic heavy metal sensor [Gammaproteobacteria bacterium]
MNTTTIPRRRLLGRIAILALAVAGATSAGVWAQAHTANGGPHMMAMGGMSPAEMADHIPKLLEHIYVEVDATPEQKAQLDPILRQAVTDLTAMHTQAHGAHAQAIALLTADKVDRSALETLRASHLQMADQASKRFVQLIADVADILTPAQRKTLAERIAQHHDAQASGHHG